MKIATCSLLFVGLMASLLPAAVVDHHGQDVTITSGQVMSGTHINVGTFTVPFRSVLKVAPYRGDPDSGEGTLEIHARSIVVRGMIDARGAGYSGGSGGGTGYLAEARFPPGYVPYLTATNEGDYGQEPEGEVRRGGNGGLGDGVYGGDFGTGSDAPTGGKAGGYMALEANGDTTVGLETFMGSGGGGGGGGGATITSTFNVAGGGGGGCGGGEVRLFAVQMTMTGTIRADGMLGGNASDLGLGGDAFPPEDGLGIANGGVGGAGAGGGVLLYARTYLEEGGRITSAGGGGYSTSTTNGGTIKVFGATTLPPTIPQGFGGRFFTRENLSGSTSDWSVF